jgi:hypothetical protein
MSIAHEEGSHDDGVSSRPYYLDGDWGTILGTY